MGEPHLVARPSPGNAVSFTREAVPRLWAQTQNNLGFALRRLGERKPGIGHLEQAIVAHQAALEIFNKEASA